MNEAALTTAITRYVDAGELAGAAMLVWRDGKATTICVGHRDLDAQLPVQRDTIYRIASMSKPVTSVLALMLMEEGRFALGDPITRWAPEFAQMRVLRTPDGALDDTVPAERPITFDDLLTHRAGLTYGDFHAGPIAAAYRELGGDIDTSLSPDAWIARLASLPLIGQPGQFLTYGKATDLLGLIVERMAGASLAEAMQRRIFEPLGMKDTGFTVDDRNLHRRAGLHGFDATGRPTTLFSTPGGHALPERPQAMTFFSGGQGLWSTLDDYLTFARIFVDGGAVNGVRLLRPETLAMMMSNQLTPTQRTTSQMLGVPIFAQGHGFGLGVAVVMEPDKADPTRVGGGLGSVGWPGAYGGWWQADPNDGSVLIFLTHNMVELDQMLDGIGLGVWGAIRDFQSLASQSL